MKRQRIQPDRVNYGEFFDDDTDITGAVPMGRFGHQKRDNLMMAQVQEGDTLQAICLRYNCSLAELKRINKIEKEIEIHARSTIRIPVTPYTVLLDTNLPAVHSSGNSSPKHAATAPTEQILANNPLFDERLMIASISNAPGPSQSTTTINDIILESKITPSEFHDNQPSSPRKNLDATVPLLSGELDDNIPQPRPIPVRHRFEISFNGTDCDMSWVCLFIFILLLCVAIPLIYVLWTVEHNEHLHHLHDSEGGGGSGR